MVEPHHPPVDGPAAPAAPLPDTSPSSAVRSSGWLISNTRDTPEPRQRLAPALRALRAAGLTVDVMTPAAAVGQPATAGDAPHWMVVDLPPHTGAVEILLAPIRRAFPEVPLLALVSTGDTDLAVQAIQAGAADFCNRSAAAWELPARVRALDRRRSSFGQCVQVGDLMLDLEARSARVGDTPLSLTTRQFELLALLMQNAGRVLSPERIEQALNLPSRARGSNVVEVHVHHLRRRLGPGRLSTLRGQGYLLHAAPSDRK